MAAKPAQIKSAQIVNITPPPLYSIEAERGLLGAVLINNNAWDQVGDTLQADHFGDPFHSRIYEIIRKLLEKGDVANPAIVAVYLGKQDEERTADDIRGYLLSLAKEAILPTPVSHYVNLIYDLAIRRNLLALTQQTVADLGTAPDPDEPAITLVERLEQGLFELAEKGTTSTGLAPMDKVMLGTIDNLDKAYKSDKHISGTATGFRDLDTVLGGLHRSDLVVLAARPSMGKTAFALNVAWNVANEFAKQQEPATVALFSLEMSAEQLSIRMLSSLSGVGSSFIRQGQISKEERTKVMNAANTVQSAPIHIDDTPSLSVAALRSRARRLKRRHNLGLIVVDYLQLLMPSGTKRFDNRVLEVSEITRTLKSIAKELDVPVVALSQLSRRTEERDDKLPQLADLRESGSIEQDADVVVFIYREAYYLKRTEPNASNEEKHQEWKAKFEAVQNQARLIVAKHRSGPTGNVELYFNPATAQFGDLDMRQE